MHGSRSKIPSKNLIYIYIYTHVKFLALLGAPYIYDISRLRVKPITVQHPLGHKPAQPNPQFRTPSPKQNSETSYQVTCRTTGYPEIATGNTLEGKFGWEEVK
jgi:hypothetical protein